MSDRDRTRASFYLDCYHTHEHELRAVGNTMGLRRYGPVRNTRKSTKEKAEEKNVRRKEKEGE